MSSAPIFLLRLPLVFLGVALAGALGAQEQDESENYRAQLRDQPARVWIEGVRQPVDGRIDLIADGKLTVERKEGTGSVVFTYDADRIERIEFAGARLLSEAQRLYREEAFSEAAPRLEALLDQRERFLPLLDSEQTRPFLILPKAQLEEGRTAEAMATATRLLNLVEPPELRHPLERVRLESSLKLGLLEEAAGLAREWCERDGLYPTDALGWRLLAERHFAKAEYKAALNTALRPVVFSSHHGVPELDACYALAIASASRLEENGYARRLLKEMHGRGIKWPAIERLKNFDPASLEEAEESRPNQSE